MLDAVVVGGGFYGASVAAYLRRQRGFRNVRLIEREAGLLSRASYSNQARVHNGYHYPRSFVTAYRSRINLPKFVKDFSSAVKLDFTKLYAVARNNSKVTARQFERFCNGIGATVELASQPLAALFEPRLIEAVFLVEEYAFDSTKLAAWAREELDQLGVQVSFGTTATSVMRNPQGSLAVSFESAGSTETIDTRYLFNCTYSGLNQLTGEFRGTTTKLKHEITEMVLIEPPAALSRIGVTVMDGAFFSMMPFPARGLHTLSHVRYTPHYSWEDRQGLNPYDTLSAYERDTRFDRMRRDAARYMPAMANARYVDSLFEVKTILVKNEGDDGRPILFERHASLPGFFSILGGKIDNIYDVLEKLDGEMLTLDALPTQLTEQP